ncbi:MAG: DNA helicase RecQ [Flavobacteriales bacterium]|nr:DNA helicase RecQ [Flavobacteriales bacterium]
MTLQITSLTDELQKYFGFKRFKSQQEAIIQNTLDGNDAFVIMPTGGGKSMCYQLPALVSDGCAVVISPLIALMKNQVDAIRGFNDSDSIAHVLNSSLSKKDVAKVKEDVESGKTKLLYVAPESLTKQENIDYLKDKKISFYAIDEAHCISEWGHDFRREYRNLKKIIENIGRAPIIALTATATTKVREDIQKNLGITDCPVFFDSFNRGNLYYDIRPKIDVEKEIIKYIKQNQGKSGIVYCLSRKKVEEIAETLQVNGINALPYHAGLENKTRVKHQDAFLMEDVDVIVATIAFGMGIDKPDIRYVIHHDIPKSLESYYQETGRAGRDGGEGNCVTFYSYNDIEKLEKFLQGKPVAEQEIGRQLILETISFAETSMCRRKYILHYFGEKFDEANCNEMCDNCRHPKPKFNGERFIIQLLECVLAINERLKAKEVVKVLVGESNALIKQHKSEALEEYGKGSHKSKGFWHAVIRQSLVKGLLVKEIESYGILKVSEKGKEFLKESYEVLFTEDHDYDAINSKNAANSNQKSAAADAVLFKNLKELRKKFAKSKELPPNIIFSEASLIDMANQYPITTEELSQIHGVGQGKANKFGKPFLDYIKEYVEENDIIRPEDMVIKTIAKQSSNKVYIIQSIDRKLSIEDIASAKGLTVEDLITEIETIVESGTKINLNYYLEEIIDEYQEEELIDFFKNSKEGTFDEARSEFEEDEYTDEELRLFRIKFISDVAN